MKKRFLVVSPHPDDAELGLGGTIIKLKKQGHKVFIVDLTSGEPTPFGTQAKRKKETEKATRILGVDTRVNLGLANRYLFDSKEARMLLAEKIREYKPDILFSPYFEDVHPDHVGAAKISEAARFYAKYTKLKLKGKPHYPFYLFYYFCTHLRNLPLLSFTVDVSDSFRGKIKAVKCYKSQFIDNPRNRAVIDYIESQNRYLGNLARCRYAEALFCKELLRVEDLNSFL